MPELVFVEVKEGDVQLDQIDVINQNDYIVLETLMTQLKTVQEAYPERIKVIEKGN